MAKKDKNLMYVVWAMLGVAIVNILATVFGYAQPIIEMILLPLGFFGFLAIMYMLNKFEFKSKLDLALIAVIVGVLFYIGTGAQALMPSTALLTAAVLTGLSPLLIGVVGAGVPTILVGLVKMKK